MGFLDDFKARGQWVCGGNDVTALSLFRLVDGYPLPVCVLTRASQCRGFLEVADFRLLCGKKAVLLWTSRQE